MPSPKRGIAERSTRKAKVNITRRNNTNGVLKTTMAALLSGRPFPKPPAHPGAPYKVTQNAREAARKGMNKFQQRSYTRSKSKSAGPSPYRMFSSAHRRELLELKEKGYDVESIIRRLQASHATLERLTRPPSTSKVAHSRSSSASKSAQGHSMGDKLIHYTEDGAPRTAKLKNISLDSNLLSLLRAEEMGWLVRHAAAAK
jgi:hypothetical protein